MKLAANDVAATLCSSGKFTGLLIYGQDWGLVRDRALAAIKAVLGAASNPFQLTSLTRDEHSRLRGEADSRSLGGGRRVIHVQGATDGLVTVLDSMRLQAADVLLVVEAGELTPRSKMRVFAEKRPDWGAIACYPSSAGQIATEIQTALATAGMTATRDAVSFLADELTGESVTRRSELDKLILFAAGERSVDLSMARLCCSLSLETSINAAAGAALAGRVEEFDALMAGLAQEGVTGAGLLAVLSNQVQRLMKVRLLVDSGKSAEEACRVLTPPLYPRQAAAFIHDVSRWSAAALEGLGRSIREADTGCKRGGSPDVVIASHLLSLVAARRAARS